MNFSFGTYIINLIKLIRPANVLLTALTVILSGYISSNEVNVTLIILAAVSAGLTAASGNVINDIVDIKTDKINKPGRPIASGIVSVKAAYILFTALNITSLLLTTFISNKAFIIVLLTQVLLWIYSRYLKNTVLFGNIAVSFLTALAFIFGGVVVNNISGSLFPSLFAFLANFIREIVKDIEDIKGDKNNNIVTLPVKYGVNKSILIAISITVVLIFLTFAPFFLKIYHIEYLFFVVFTVDLIYVAFIKSVLNDNSTKNLSKWSGFLKLNMLLGLFSILLGTYEIF